MTDEPTLRADAERNRERILVAAEEVFLERGAGASLDDVAKRAGVGIGTLYRRFPTREALLAAAFSARFLEFAEASRRRAQGRNPMAALRGYLEDLIRQSNVYRGIAVLLGTVLQTGTPGCVATSAEGARLLQLAQAAGAARSDISFDDLVCVATAISLATEAPGAPEQQIAHLVDIFLSGIEVR